MLWNKSNRQKTNELMEESVGREKKENNKILIFFKEN